MALVPAVSATSETMWEALTPTSFQITLYVPCLKLTITAGSFVLFRKEGSTPPCSLVVGRVIDVASSIDGLPQAEREALGPSPNGIMFANINVFKDRSMCDVGCFPADDSLLSCSGWNNIVQVEDCHWVPSSAIAGLAFVFMDQDVTSNALEDCVGMDNFFVVKYRQARNGVVSPVRRDMCRPFAESMDNFHKIWSVDHCQIIFSCLCQIRRELQSLLCTVAQAQGDFSTRNSKIQVPGFCWYYIKNTMSQQGTTCIHAPFTQRRSLLSWGLTYESRRHRGCLEILRFDTVEKLKNFRTLFGTIAGYGVRKKRPKYSEGKAYISLNDVLNVVFCQDESGESSTLFTRFGVTRDGIDFVYEPLHGTLQIVVRYHKLVVRKESLEHLRSVGVTLPSISSAAIELNESINGIMPNMEFMDGIYLMCVISVSDTEVRAKQKYKVVGERTMIVTDPDIVVYTDISSVTERIKEMLE